MRFHVLDRTFERIGTCVFDDTIPDAPRMIDLSTFTYDTDLTDAQVLALIIGLILKGVI